MGDSAIEWTDKVWNPTTGCTRVSEGCRNCYAFQLHDQRHAAHKAGKAVPAQYAKPFKELQLFPDRLTDPLSWRKPCRVFVNSMSDLFHKDVPDEFIAAVFGVMAVARRHTFQVLTKRPERMREWFAWIADQETGPVSWSVHCASVAGLLDQRGPDWWATEKGQEPGTPWPLPNVWLGVSVEDRKTADERIPLLLETPAAVRFLSCEPLLGPLEFSNVGGRSDCVKQLGRPALAGIGWVIVGGESGPGARPMHPDWPLSIRDQCQAAGVPFFFKQWGEWCGGEDFFSSSNDEYGPAGLYADLQNGTAVHESKAPEGGWKDWLGDDESVSPNDPVSVRVGKKAAGRLLDGRTWDEFPAAGRGA